MVKCQYCDKEFRSYVDCAYHQVFCIERKKTGQGISEKTQKCEKSQVNIRVAYSPVIEKVRKYE